MWLDNIKYRDNLNLNKNITFGVEIEFDNARKKYVSDDIMAAYTKKIINKPWKLENDETIYNGTKTYSTKGGEAISDILKDNRDTWNNIKTVCNIIKNNRGYINNNCGSHVHIGAKILDDNIKHYDRLMKLWIIYEDIILRFCYGETNKPRNNFNQFAGSPFFLFKIIYDNFYDNNKLQLTFEQFIRGVNSSINYKNLAISFRTLEEEYVKNKYKEIDDWYKYRTIEFRAANGTLNPTIWQNYINLYTKLLLCCKNESKDWDEIDKLFIKNYNCEELEKYNIEKAINFSEFVFEDYLDKYNFMLQYKKDEIYKNFNSKTKKKIYK